MASTRAEVGPNKSGLDLEIRPANTAKAHARLRATKLPPKPESDPLYKEELAGTDWAGIVGMGEAGGT